MKSIVMIRTYVFRRIALHTLVRYIASVGQTVLHDRGSARESFRMAQRIRGHHGHDTFKSTGAVVSGLMTEACMPFKHILIPTDGSEVSRRAIAMGVGLAADENAKVTGLYVGETPLLVSIESNPRQFQRELEQAKTVARQYLGEVEQAAKEAGVQCETVYDDENRSVPDAIARITESRHCDLVVMGTYGRHGLTAILGTSHVKAVAKHLDIPVLVVH
jgi:nucleotide-binding universal stress UspA family protein